MKHVKKNPSRDRNLFPLFWGLVLFAFVGFAAIDTFLLPHSAETIVMREISPHVPAFNQWDTTAEDTGGIHTAVSLTTHRYLTSTIYVADIVLADITDLKTAFALSRYGTNIAEYTSSIAKRVGATLAINGDYYGAKPSGYVIRNGVLYRDTPSSRTDLVFFSDGSHDIIRETDVSAAQLMERGAWQLFSFGPAILTQGEVSTSPETITYAHEAYENPRTAIGIYSNLHIVFVVVDGRTALSEGLTTWNLAQFMRDELGVTDAYNLDGGGTSIMVGENGAWISNPSGDGSYYVERAVSDIVYVIAD